MRDQRLDKLADVLVRYSTKVKRGDVVEIVAEPRAMALIEAVTESVLKAGGHPMWVGRSERLHELLVSLGSDEQLSFVQPSAMFRAENADVHIGLWADVNTRYLGRVDPKRQAMAQAARRPLMKIFMNRVATGSMRWCGTQFPTEASAQDADRSLRDYEDFVFKAGLLHLADPVAAWEKIHATQERVREMLQPKKDLRFRVPATDAHDGTDLTVPIEGGTWVNCAGTENFPDGEIFTGPHGADGHVNYTFPAVYAGREVVGVRLAFKGGRVVDASATKNEAFLIEMLDQDEGARTLGEIAIGTNYAIREFTRNTLFDEKIGGTFHAAVGAGIPESGNTNESALHWDMVCDLRPIHGQPGGTIEADGEVFHRDGRFLGDGMPGPA
jgi:aminopeptidase